MAKAARMSGMHDLLAARQAARKNTQQHHRPAIQGSLALVPALPGTSCGHLNQPALADAAADAAADALVQKALQAGTSDNVTALLMLMDWQQ